MLCSACLKLISVLSLFPLDSVTDLLASAFSLVHTGLDFKESSIWILARILKSWGFATKSGFLVSLDELVDGVVFLVHRSDDCPSGCSWLSLFYLALTLPA